MNKSNINILQSIKDLSKRIIPSDSQVFLFGSQARGDAKPTSDWDVMILLNKPYITQDDHDNYCYPFFELGWQIDAEIHPIIYSLKEYSDRKHITPLFLNIEKEGVRL